MKTYLDLLQHILDNGGDLARLYAQVEALDRLYRELARSAPP